MSDHILVDMQCAGCGGVWPCSPLHSIKKCRVCGASDWQRVGHGNVDIPSTDTKRNVDIPEGDMMFEPTREELDAHKARRMRNPYVIRAWESLTVNTCRLFIIEQLGDAELYQARLAELEASDE